MNAPGKFCDLGNFISHHFNVLMDVFKNELNVGSMYTKCLYTATTLMFLICGDKAKIATQYCQVPNVEKRLQNNPHRSDIIKQQSQKLVDDVLRYSSRRMVYYVMITNAMLPRSEKKQDKKLFPGHVFVIEKLVHPMSNENLYMVYQSYINNILCRNFHDSRRNLHPFPRCNTHTKK